MLAPFEETFEKGLSKVLTEKSKKGLIINLDVIPGSGRFKLAGINEWNNHLKVKVKAQPEKGKANSEIVKEFSKFCSRATIIAGEKSRKKRILLEGDPEEVAGKISLEIKNL